MTITLELPPEIEAQIGKEEAVEARTFQQQSSIRSR